MGEVTTTRKRWLCGDCHRADPGTVDFDREVATCDVNGLSHRGIVGCPDYRRRIGRAFRAPAVRDAGVAR